jgi:hypothetical protein
MELHFVQKLRERQRLLGLNADNTQHDEKKQAFMDGVICQAIYRNAIKVKTLVSDWKFRMQFLHYVPRPVFDAATDTVIDHFDKLRTFIIEDACTAFGHIGEFWAARATYEISVNTVLYRERRNASSVLETDARAMRIYEDAVQVCEDRDVWVRYVDYLQQRIDVYVKNASKAIQSKEEEEDEDEDDDTSDSDQHVLAVQYLYTRLFDVCQRASDKGQCTADMFAIWARKLIQVGRVSSAFSTLKVAIQDNTNSVELQLLYIQLLTRQAALKIAAVATDDYKTCCKEYAATVSEISNALDAVDSDSGAVLDMWIVLLNFACEINTLVSTHADNNVPRPQLYRPVSQFDSPSTTVVHALFEKAIIANSTASRRIIELYFVWAYCTSTGNIDSIHRVVTTVSKQPSTDLATYLLCIRTMWRASVIHGSNRSNVASFIRNLCEKAIREYPDSADLWIVFRDIEHRSRNTKRVSAIYQRATRTLSPSEKQVFIRHITLHQ